MALEMVPPSIERIDVIELEPEVFAANRCVASGRWRDPLSDPRVHVHLNDARNALLLASGALRRDRLPALAPLGGRRRPPLHARVLLAREEPSRARRASSCSGSACRSSTSRCSARCSRRLPTCSPTCRPTRRRPTARCCSSPRRRRSTWRRALRARSPRRRSISRCSASRCPEDVTAQPAARRCRRPRARGRGAAQSRRPQPAAEPLRVYARTRSPRASTSLIAPVDPLVRARPEGTDVFYLLRRLTRSAPARRALAAPIPSIAPWARRSPDRRGQAGRPAPPARGSARRRSSPRRGARRAAAPVSRVRSPRRRSGDDLAPAALRRGARDRGGLARPRARFRRGERCARSTPGWPRSRSPSARRRTPCGCGSRAALERRSRAVRAEAVELADASLGDRPDPSSHAAARRGLRGRG